MTTLDKLNLHRFDGAAEGGAAQAAPEGTPGDGGTPEGGAQPQETAEQRQARYEQVLGEFRDLDEARMEREIRQRTRGARQTMQQLDALQQAVQPLYALHGLQPGDVDGLGRAIAGDNSYWERGAEEAGMTVEQYRQMRETMAENERLRAMQLRAENEAAAERQYRAWLEEADAVRGTYPEFDLQAELDNPLFVSLITSKNEATRLSLRAAYEACHVEQIRQQAARSAAENAARNLTQSIAAGQSRPRESGAGAAPAAAPGKIDVSKLTRAQMREYIRRAEAGEKITFQDEGSI